MNQRYVKAYQVTKGRVEGVLADVDKGQITAIDTFRGQDMNGGKIAFRQVDLSGTEGLVAATLPH
jgi:hypothetical protein